MELPNNLKKATAFKNELDNLRPLTPEQEKRMMQKFRLDWNYHSSKIEGNSLTYGETKALILFGQTAQAKPLKDHLEISGHDEAIKYIEDVIKKQRPLTESFIRDLHKITLKQPYQVDAITPDGKPTKKWIRIGEYKTFPNHVLTKTGEVFYFATPEETPAEMAELMKWYKEEVKNDTLHPVIFATEFHYRFIRIHPFDDGNGRIARLLMNFILMQKGYPPAIIKTEEKEDYYRALEQADAGQIEYFFNFVCEQVVHSLGLMLRAARGEEVEESEDIDKKLQLLKLRLGKEPKSKMAIKRSAESIKNVLKKSVVPLIKELEKELVKFDSLFKSRQIVVKYGNSVVRGSNFVVGFNQAYSNFIGKDLEKKPHSHSLVFESTFKGLINSTKNISVKGLNFSINFFENVYEITGSGINVPISKLYDSYLDHDEIKHIVSPLCNWQYGILEKSINEILN